MAEPLIIEDLIAKLQKCRLQKNRGHARRLYASMCEHHLENHIVLGNHLVPLLADCGSLSDALHVFHRLPLRNQYAWTSLLSACVAAAQPYYAFCLYHRMQEELVRPSSYTFVAILKACSSLADADRGLHTHTEVIRHGLERVSHVGVTLLDMYGKCGLLAEVRSVFQMMPAQDLLSWTALVSAFVDNGLNEEALNFLEQMQMQGISPNDHTFVCALKACIGLEDSRRGREIHVKIITKQVEQNLFIGSTLVDMYGKSGFLQEAGTVFNRLPIKDQIAWTALISGCAKHGLGEKALNYLKQMQAEGISPSAHTYLCGLKACDSLGSIEKIHSLCAEIAKNGLQKDVYLGTTMMDVYLKYGFLAEAQEVFDQLMVKSATSWTVLIAGFVEHQFGDKALTCLKKMQMEGISPDDFTLTCSLKACGILGALETGRELHIEATRKGLEGVLSVANMLVEMYGRCGSLVDGWDVFSSMPVKDVISWTVMMKAYRDNEKSAKALECFKDMQDVSMKPDAMTFTCLLSACSHASLVHKGQDYFRLMCEEHALEATSYHYACMVDLFARSGQLHEAERLFKAMQFLPPEGEVLRALLSACNLHGDTELGLRCFQQLVKVNKEFAAGCSTMPDIYAKLLGSEGVPMG